MWNDDSESVHLGSKLNKPKRKLSIELDFNNNDIHFVHTDNSRLILDSSNAKKIKKTETITPFDFSKSLSTRRSSSEHSSLSNYNHKTEKAKLVYNLLKNVISLGDFAVFGEAVQLPNFLGLNVKNFGILSQPLHEVVAQNLMSHSTRVTNQIYQIDSSKIEIQNSQWNVSLKQLINSIGKQMGCSGMVDAILSKLVLHRKGAFISKHSRVLDISTEENKFGILIIQLPSVFTGGELSVYHGRECKQIDFEQETGKSQYTMHYAAFYSDLDYEMSEIDSGNCLQLIYSLCWSRSSQQSQTKRYDYMNFYNLVDQLSVALRDCGENDVFALALNENYQDSEFKEIGINGLKGIDRNEFEFIKLANDKLNSEEKLKFYIVHVSLLTTQNGHRKISSFYEEDTFDDSDETGDVEENFDNWKELEEAIDDREIEINIWFDGDTGRMPFFKNNRISFDFFSHLINLKTNHGVESLLWWGNGNMETSLLETKGNEAIRKAKFHKHLLVFWSDRFERNILLENKFQINFEKLMNTFENDLSKKKFLDYFETILNSEDQNELVLGPNDPILEKIITNLSKMNNLELCKLFLTNVLPSIFHNVADQLSYAIVHYGWSNLRDSFRFDEHFIQNPLNSIYLVRHLIYVEFQKDITDIEINCFNDLILPILNNQNSIKNIRMSLDQVTLYEIVSYFDEQFTRENETPLNKFENLIKLINFEDFKGFIDEMIKRFAIKPSYYLNCSTLINLFKFYLDLLDTRIKPFNEFSWSMPLAQVPDHPILENFLHGSQSSFKYGGCFKGITYANAFADQYNGIHLNFSLSITPGGAGKDSYVLIKKTRDYFDSQVKKNVSIQKEKETIKNVIKMYLIKT